MTKRILSVLLAAIFACILPLQALATAETPLGGMYEISFHMEPQYFSPDRQAFMEAIADGLNALTLKGRLTYMGLEKFHTTGSLFASGYEAITYTAKGSERCIALNSNLFGDETSVLMMLVWLEFWMKPYNFYGIPTQYAAFLTSTYAHKSAWEPVIQLWNQHFAGEGSRAYTYQQCMDAATALSTHMVESREIYYWLLASVGYVGKEDTCLEFFSSLPDYVTQYAGKDGITVTCNGGTETWMLGKETFFTKVASDAGWTWTLSLPAWNEHSLNATWAYADRQEMGIDVQFNAVVTLAQQADPLFTMDAAATGLPNGQNVSGNSLADLHISGSLLDPGFTAFFSGEWATTQIDDDVITNITIALTDNATREPKLWTDIQFTAAEPEDVLNFTDADIQLLSPDNVFTFNETTLADFISRVKVPFARALIPLALNMPTTFINEVIGWLQEIGILDMLMP